MLLKHISFDFYKEWLTLLPFQFRKRYFCCRRILGSGISSSSSKKYIEVTEGCMSLFDSSLQNNFHTASREGDSYDLRRIFDETLTQADPMHSVSLVANHDTQPLQDLEAPVEPWFKPIAYALIFIEKRRLSLCILPRSLWCSLCGQRQRR